MKSLFFELPLPAIIGHRGASAYSPENTLASFQLALQQGCDALELDVKLCAGDEAVVIHDATVNRTTNGSGKVAELPLAALRELDAGSHFDHAFTGERIPTLAEVFETVGHKTYINVELTNYTTPKDRLPEVVAGLVARHRMEQRVLISSFNPFTLRRFKRLLPEIPIGLLAVRGFASALVRSSIGQFIVNHHAIHPEVNDIKPGFIERRHRRGLRVYTYTVNDALQMKQLFAQRVDGIFTDDPLLARAMLKESQPMAARHL
jgi:glycerophosphoryl diester phosphodiesterase